MNRSRPEYDVNTRNYCYKKKKTNDIRDKQTRN